MSLIWNAATAYNDNWVKVAISDTGRYVAVNYGGSTTMYSDDGLSWIQVSLPYPLYDIYWKDVTWGDGLFVAVGFNYGRNNIMTSPDGINWTLRTPVDQFSFAGVAYGAGCFIAVSNTGNFIAKSTDGITWITILGPDGGGVPLPGGFSTYLMAVDFCNGKFLVSAASGTNRIMYSSDGSSWSVAPSSFANPLQINGFAGNESMIVGVGVTDFGYSNFDSIVYSYDGITWNVVTLLVEYPWRDVIFSTPHGLFIAINNDTTFGLSDKSITSVNGIDWIINSTFSPNYGQYNGIACGPERVVAVGFNAYGYNEPVMYTDNPIPPIPPVIVPYRKYYVSKGDILINL